MPKALFLLALLALVAGRVEAQSCPGVAPWVFDDVLESDSFCPNVTWMAQHGVTVGCATIDADNRLYCPNDAVTRIQMAAFMNRLGNNTFVQGGNAFGSVATLGTLDDNAVEIHANGARVMRYEPGATSPNVIGGLANNSVTGYAATVAGGGLSGSTCFEPSSVSFVRSCGNHAGFFAFVGGGIANVGAADGSAVVGGESNTASGDHAIVGGGLNNTAAGFFAVVGGGAENSASGAASTVAGGHANTASGVFSFAAGHRAKASTRGTFVWADSNDFDFVPGADNFFGARATGGVGFTVAIDNAGTPIQSCNYLPGYSGWSCTSDRNAKENLVRAATADVLERLVAMPIYTYNFRGADPRLHMMGPTAQDFYSAFGLGDSDKTIASGNIQGVTVAAIQGLNTKLDDQLRKRDEEIRSLRADVAELQQLRKDVAELRQLLFTAPIARH